VSQASKIARLTTLGGVAIVAVALFAAPASAGSGGTPASTRHGSATFPAIATQVKAWLRRPTSIAITTPLGAPIPKGKTIWWLQNSSPATIALGKDLTKAVAAVGWKLKIVDIGLTPETIKAGWDLAVSGKPDAVISSGFPRSLFEPELQALKKRNIPVLDMTTADAPGNGLTAVFDYGPDYLKAGDRLARYVLSKSGTNVKAAIINSSAFPNLGLVGKGFQQTLQKYCSSCSVDNLDVPVTSIGSDLPVRVSTFLQAHPDVNWVYIGYSDMLVGVPAALQSAGITSNVKFVTIDLSPTTAVYLKNQQFLAATDGFPGPEIMWRTVDFLLRYFDHKPTTPSTTHNLPVWLVTSSNVPSTTNYFSLVPNYQAQYKKLWGVS
jgi:ribose transport system substrate-binding protein